MVRESAPSPRMKEQKFDLILQIDENEELPIKIDDDIQSPIRLADVMRADEEFD